MSEAIKEQLLSQIKFDRDFVKKILDKLKVGNSRSIHLNAIPGRSATRLDLFQLEHTRPGVAREFIDILLSKESFLFPISYDEIDLGALDDEEKKKLALITKRLNALVIENEDNFLEFGLNNFGFGYPLLIKRDQKDPTKIIKAPIFIWSLDIKRSYQNKNSWTIEREVDSSIKINELLIAHLSKDELIQIEKISDQIMEDGLLDKEELLGLVSDTLSKLEVDVNYTDTKLEECLDSKAIEDITNSKPWVQWSGVFGIYRSQNETIIHATESLLDRILEFNEEDLVLEQFQTHTVSAVDTDPSKEEIINTLNKDEIKLIQGPPGTGKSQSITAIISNALANNATCLVVCEKKTALDVIYSNLEKIGLDEFAVVIDDVNKDRKKVIEKARRIKDSIRDSHFSSFDFNTKYERFENLREEINSKHAEVLRNVFGDYSWKQLVGHYLRCARSADLSKLNQSMSYTDLELSRDEYSKLHSVVEEASMLFVEVESGSGLVFAKINQDVFASAYSWKTKEDIQHRLQDVAMKLEEMGTIFSRSTATFQFQGVSLFEKDNIDKTFVTVSELVSCLEKSISLYQTDLTLDKEGFEKYSIYLKSLFNSRFRKVLEIRNEIDSLIKQAQGYISALENQGLRDLEKITPESFESYAKKKEYLKNFLIKAKGIFSSLKKIKENKEKIQDYESFILDKLSSDIFTLDIKEYTEFSTSKELKEFYLNLNSQITELLEHMDSYESLHNWKFFCKRRSRFESELLKLLLDIPSENWSDVFSAWYYRGVLLQHEEDSDVGFHGSDTALHQLSNVYEELKKTQISKIASIWSENRSDRLSEFNYNFNTLYNLRKNSVFNKKNSLRKLLEIDFPLFTSLFPVILTNPGAANAILPLEQGIFNVVIFDEASQLKISDTFTSLIRGQFKVIAGDEHQMPPSNYFQGSAQILDTGDEESSIEEDENSILAEAESLLQYASDLRVINKSYLDFHYRSNHPALIEFSNSAFYGGNLISFPASEVYKPIDFRAVNGRYEARTNPDEVAEIVNIIAHEIHPNDKGKYPSVGIATFNINQRNLITETLNEVAEKDDVFSKKLQALRERGLFVKNLENIQGDEKDIIIISTTYGIQEDGRFSQNFARLNRIEGYKLLNVLITRAKHKLYVCTSIPREKYLAYQEIIANEGNNKRGILYAYLSYAEAVSNHDSELASSILKSLKEQSFEKPRMISSEEGLSESPFEEEVYYALLDHFDKDQIIQQYKIGGFRLDFLLKTEKGDIVLECDGKAYHQSEEAYAYDMYRQKELEKMGLLVYRIWSTNWFRDKDLEIRKLLRYFDAL